MTRPKRMMVWLLATIVILLIVGLTVEHHQAAEAHRLGCIPVSTVPAGYIVNNNPTVQCPGTDWVPRIGCVIDGGYNDPADGTGGCSPGEKPGTGSNFP